MKILTDSELETELRRIVETIQAKRFSIYDDHEAPFTNVGHPQWDLWHNLLDIEYYALEALQDMGCAV